MLRNKESHIFILTSNQKLDMDPRTRGCLHDMLMEGIIFTRYYDEVSHFEHHHVKIIRFITNQRFRKRKT